MSEPMAPGALQSFKLERGKPTKFQGNKPMRFEIETFSGSLIEGVVTPNHPLTITSSGDLKNFHLYVEEDLLRPLCRIEAA